MNTFDVIVIGGGPMGLSAAYHLGQRGSSVLVLEQADFFNQDGSSAGVSRQFRIPYPEEYMVKLVKQSIPFWDQLQSQTDTLLLDPVGTLWFGDPTVQTTEGNIGQAEISLKAQDVPYERLTAAEIEKNYGFQNLPPSYRGLFQPEGAAINLVATLRTLFDWCSNANNVQLQQRAKVTSIVEKGGIFDVATPAGTFKGKKLVIVPGPYVNSVINLLGFNIAATYWNMASGFYRVKKPEIKYPTWFVFQQPVPNNPNLFYGFPEVSWNYPGYARVASDFVMTPLTSPDQRTSTPNPQELALTSAWVRDHMPGLDPEPAFTSTCLIALSDIPNKELLIDFAPPEIPGHKNIVIYATGWAGKFVPLLGSILADLALEGKTSFDISRFKTGSTYFSLLKR